MEIDKINIVNKGKIMLSQTDRTKLTGYPSIDRPWLSYYPLEIIQNQIPDVTIYDYLYENNIGYPKDIAIKYLGSKISYRTLFKKIEQCAKSMKAIGCKKGDIVTVAMPSMPEAVYVIYACSYLGLIANVIHPLASEDEILFYLNEVKSEVFMMFSGTYKLIKNSLRESNVKTSIVVSPFESAHIALRCLKRKEEKLAGNILDWHEFIQKGTGIKLVKETTASTDPVVISHTGGTSGKPKGVVLSNINLIAEIWQIGSTMKGGRGTSMLTVLPPFVNYSLTNCILEPISLGITSVMIPKYEADKICHYIKKYRPEHINSIPPYWEILLRSEDAGETDFSSIINAFYGGEKMADENVEKINEIFAAGGSKATLMSGYGMTESVSAATATYENCCSKGSSGIPLVKMNCKIVSVDDGTEMRYDEEGEICFSGPTLMIGYFANQEETDEIIRTDKDGVRWLHTGDVGYISEAGEVFITGRIKRIFITKGNDGIATKLFPDRIERALLQLDDIDECCVVEKADPERINIAVAFIKMKPGILFDEYRIRGFIQEKLPSYMIPVIIKEVKDLPRTSRGKIDYRAVKQTLI